MSRRLLILAVSPLLGGCGQVYPAESYFAELRNQQYDLERGVIFFEESSEWAASAKKYGFKVDGWTVTAVGLDCEKSLTRERPRQYRIDAGLGIIEFGRTEKTRCFLRGRDAADFMIYPIISSRGLFDPGEVDGAEHFSIVFKPVIR